MHSHHTMLILRAWPSNGLWWVRLLCPLDLLPRASVSSSSSRYIQSILCLQFRFQLWRRCVSDWNKGLVCWLIVDLIMSYWYSSLLEWLYWLAWIWRSSWLMWFYSITIVSLHRYLFKSVVEGDFQMLSRWLYHTLAFSWVIKVLNAIRLLGSSSCSSHYLLGHSHEACGSLPFNWLS